MMEQTVAITYAFSYLHCVSASCQSCRHAVEQLHRRADGTSGVDLELELELLSRRLPYCITSDCRRYDVQRAGEGNLT